MERKIEVDRACERLRVEVEQGAREAEASSSSSSSTSGNGSARAGAATGRVYEAFNRYLALAARWLGKGAAGDARRLLASGAEAMAGVGCVQEAQELTLRMIGCADVSRGADADDANLALGQLMNVLGAWPVREIFTAQSARGEEGGFKAAADGGAQRVWLGFEDMPEEVKTYVIVIETALSWAKGVPAFSARRAAPGRIEALDGDGEPEAGASRPAAKQGDNLGVQAVHLAAARYLHRTGSFFLLKQSSRHFVWAGNLGAEAYAEALADIVQNRAPGGAAASGFEGHRVPQEERDLFVARAVLQYLSVGRAAEAGICNAAFRRLVPVPETPLLHFTDYLLTAAGLAPTAGVDGRLALVRLLRRKYAKSIGRDGSGSFGDMLDKVEVVVFGAAPSHAGAANGHGNGDAMVNMLRGMFQS